MLEWQRKKFEDAVKKRVNSVLSGDNTNVLAGVLEMGANGLYARNDTEAMFRGWMLYDSSVNDEKGECYEH